MKEYLLGHLPLISKDGKRYPAGSIVELDEELAQILLDNGFIQELELPAAEAIEPEADGAEQEQ